MGVNFGQGFAIMILLFVIVGITIVTMSLVAVIHNLKKLIVSKKRIKSLDVKTLLKLSVSAAALLLSGYYLLQFVSQFSFG